MADTTNLSDLPSDPTGRGGGNIVLDTSEKPAQYTPNVESTQTDLNQIDQQKMMNEIVTGIQQANANGGTSLPSRDIPQSTIHFADEATQPNFVPSLREQKDYIQNNDSEHEILARRIKSQNTKDSLEILYDEFQIPIIIGLLFFIFQLPVVRSKFLSILPSLHKLDGNPNLTGYILTSIFFGICYYVISKSLTHMQTI
jgi:hypothetical protein